MRVQGWKMVGWTNFPRRKDSQALSRKMRLSLKEAIWTPSSIVELESLEPD